MIKDISKLSEKSRKYQKEFLTHCLVSEKISAFYFHVKVQSRNLIKFYKSNYQELEPVDLILNRMWQVPINDFTRMFFSDDKFIQDSLGMTYSFFFFPVSKPLGIDYRDSENSEMSFRYILDNIKLPNGEIVKTGYISQFKDIDTNHLIRENGIVLGNIKFDTISLKDFIKENNPEKYKSLIVEMPYSLTRESNLCKQSKIDSEGFILKYKNDTYQITNNTATDKIIGSQNDNRLALEMFTHNFMEFLSKNDFMEFLSGNDYIKNVCNLTINYKKWIETTDQKNNVFSYYNITAENLTAPNFGYYPGTLFELIPNPQLRELCKKDELWDNIFKILLNGLRKEKKLNRNTLIVSEQDIQTWNKLVKILSETNSMRVLRNSLRITK